VEQHKEATDFDRLVTELQHEIDEQERAIFSDKVIAEARNPTHLGRMADPDAYGIIHGWCGDTMEFYLRLDGQRIEQVAFMTDGCGSSLACGNTVAKMAQGKVLEEAVQIRPEDVITALDGLPKQNAHCAQLAVNTLREAIVNRD
jgi:nitrogen fixation NifU-like protein